MFIDEQHKHEVMSTFSLIVDPEKLIVDAIECMSAAVGEWEFSYLSEFLEKVSRFRELVESGLTDSWDDFISGACPSLEDSYIEMDEEDYDPVRDRDFGQIEDISRDKEF